MAPRKKVEPPPRRIFPSPPINTDCRYRDSQCFIGFECVACAYDKLVTREQPLHVGLWHDYSHNGKPIELKEAFKAPEAPRRSEPVNVPNVVQKPTPPPTSIRRLASGTRVEVDRSGRIIRTLGKDEE